MPTDNPPFRAAVIGLGFIGAGDQVSGDAIGQRVSDLDGVHAAALASNRRVFLVAGASRDDGRRERFKSRYCVERVYADWRDMLTREKPDIVSVATNSPQHAPITIACAQAGVRAVICEKPIATRLSDADRAIRECRERGTLLVVNHNRRWSPFWRSIREEIEAGGIGQPRFATVYWTSGRLGNIGTHLFDLLRMLLRDEAIAVSGQLDATVPPDCRGPAYHDPGGWGRIEFAGGVQAFVHADHAPKTPLRVGISGTLGQINVRGDRAVIESWSEPPREIRAARTPGTSLDHAVDDVVACLTESRRPCSTGEDGLAALEMIIGFHVSDRLRAQRVELPISGGDRDLEVAIG